MTSPYTQAVALLVAEPPDPGMIEKLLAPLCPDSSSPGSRGGGWINGYPWWRVPINGHATGRAEIMVAMEGYPRNLGESTCDEMTQACFAAGCMGPFALPSHAVNLTALPAHRGVIVVRTSYAFGKNPAEAPASANPLLDLAFSTSVAARLLGALPGAHYFSPASGVVLRGAEFAGIATKFKGLDTPPMPLWIRCRALTPAPQSALQTVDTVGMAQLGQQDLEASFVRGSMGIDASKVAILLMGIAAETVRVRSAVMAARNGPGGLWTPDAPHVAIGAPARSVIRWSRVLPM